MSKNAESRFVFEFQMQLYPNLPLLICANLIYSKSIASNVFFLAKIN